MKKIIFEVLFMIIGTLCISAQWQSINHKYDELLQNPSGTTYKFIDENLNTFEFGILGNGKSYNSVYTDITTNDGIFDYKLWGTSGYYVNVVYGIVGLYDENNKLVKRWDERFVIAENVIHEYKTCRPSKWKQIHKYLKENKGYIKFIINRYDMENFVMSVPCINN